SSAATIGIHFQESYCNAQGNPLGGYSGFVVSMTAFGIPSNQWENLTEMGTGYNGCSGPLGYTLQETVDTTTSTDGLNPLPNGSLDINWFGPTANFSGFGGYAGNPPHYNYGGAYPNGATTPTGEEQVYATFLRDGVNFGPGESSGENNQPGYYVDITGLKSLFTNSPYVVELMASGDSIQTLTNAFVIDVTGKVTNSVIYPNIPPVANSGDTAWVRGQGGGLSTGSAAMTADHLYITSAHPQHGPNGSFNHAGTISGFILTDKPVVSMSPQPIVTHPGDSVTLNPYAIGVPPLSYQWYRNGVAIPGATSTNYTIASVDAGHSGNYQLVVSNQYGTAASAVVSIPAGISQGPVGNVVADSNPNNAQENGVNAGATWLASSPDGTHTRSGVMQFNATNSTGITAAANTNYIGPVGTITFWMRSAGTDPDSGTQGAAPLFAWSSSQPGLDWVLAQTDSGQLEANIPGGANGLTSQANVSDNKWHFIAFAYNQNNLGGISLYVDGVLDSTNGNATSWAAPSSSEFELGFSTDNGWEYYNGLMDDFRIYNTILTPAQISSIYASDAVANPTALTLRFNFDAAPGAGINLTWPAGVGILQSAAQVNGPYTDVPAANGPYIVAPSATQRFFRLRYLPYTPGSYVSNPYLM